MSPRKICVVTGSRADYGLLYWPMRLIAEDDDFELQVVVTGMHLSPAFGDTWRQIEADGFAIAAKVEMLLSCDTGVAVAKSVGLGVIGFADVLKRIRPDLMLVLGDRFEILAAVQAALFTTVPVAHIGGGDATEGSLDESVRHAVSKMSHVHFVSNSMAATRLIRMGEQPSRVFVTGSPGLDRIRNMTFMDRETFFSELEFHPCPKNVLVVFHPTTLDDLDPAAQVEMLLEGLDTLDSSVGLILTGTNADTGGLHINDRLERYASSRSGARFFQSLGSVLYLNALRHVNLLIGNSSSGLYEAPSFGLPSVNIGDRQKGRLRAPSVIDCELEGSAIAKALIDALSRERRSAANPYGDGRSAGRILSGLGQFPDFSALLRKPFNDRFHNGEANG